ncbi:MAG: hypothetical protein IT536_19350 [Hyphomicrobiales bacterium]|nr:hypothetical protein [Hyphomicrobiales bacterium]
MSTFEDRRQPSVLFFGTSALALLLFYLVAVGPFMDLMADQRERIDRVATKALRMDALIERKAAIASMDSASAVRSTEAFLQGDGLSQLNANMLAKLRQVAESHEIVFNSMASQPQRTWNGAVFVGARVEFTATSLQASRFMSALESGTPFLFIHAAKLSAVARPQEPEETVAATLEIYGATRWRAP